MLCTFCSEVEVACHLPAFMVATEEQYIIGEVNLYCEHQQQDFNGECSPIDVVP